LRPSARIKSSAFHQQRGDAAATKASRGLGVGNNDRIGREAVVGKGNPAIDVEFETALCLVVADGGHHGSFLQECFTGLFKRCEGVTQSCD